MTCIANQGKAIRDNPSNDLHDKDAARYSTRQYQLLPFMRPVLMLMAMFVFTVIIIYAMNVFDDFSPDKQSFIFTKLTY